MIRLSAAQGRKLLGKRSKFNVDNSEAGKAARTYAGVLYHSGAEMRFAQSLDMRKRVGDLQDWWGQQTIPLKINGVLICKMVCDFRLLHRDNMVEFVEIKGVSTALFRLKLKILKALNPTLRYTVIAAKDVR